MRSAISKIELFLVAIAAVFGLFVLPLCNAFGSDANWWHVSNFTVSLYGKYLCYAVVAMSVDLLWGYTGLLCLGQCLFFALGGYAFGLYLMLHICELGQYHSPLPDFMVFLGYPSLPAHWVPFQHFWFSALMIILVPAIVGGVFGYLAFRSRIRGVYFSILTQALTYAATLLFFRNSLLMGGNNGFTDFKFIFGYDLREPATQRGLYMATAITVLLVYLICRWLSRTKFGLVQQAIRDSENRVLFSGYAAGNYKLFVFVLAALIGSIGGMLFVPQVGIINPSEMAPDKSLEAVVWVAVGGRGTLLGPILGAFGVNAFKSWATRAYPDLWQILLGGLFVIVTIFMPKGLVGLPAQLRGVKKRFVARRAKPAAEVASPVNTPEELAKTE